MSARRWNRVIRLVQHIPPSRPDAILEILVHIDVVVLDRELLLFHRVHQLPYVHHVGVVKVPLVVGVVLEHVETFLDAPMDAAQSESIKYSKRLIRQHKY